MTHVRAAKPSGALLAPQCLTLIARAYAAAVGAPEPVATRANYVTLHKARVGVAVQASFRRTTPTKFPEVRVGVTFRFDDGRANAAAAEAFESRFASELTALGIEPWPSETNNDRRFTTPLPVPIPGQDLSPFVARAVELAQGYVELLRRETRRADSPSTLHP
jgi:hypothetical protein